MAGTVTKRRIEPGERIAVYLPTELVTELRIYCAQSNCSMSDAVTRSLQKGLSHFSASPSNELDNRHSYYMVIYQNSNRVKIGATYNLKERLTYLNTKVGPIQLLDSGECNCSKFGLQLIVNLKTIFIT